MFYILMYSFNGKDKQQWSLSQSLMSHDLSEIILIYWFGT